MHRIIRTSIALLGLAASTAQAGRMELLVPAYSYPEPMSAYWSALNAAASRLPLTAIANPDNGPGLALDSDYAAAIAALRVAGGRVLGYVYTLYGGRGLGTVTAEIDRWYNFYAIDGIFVDEMSNESASAVLDYYAAIYDHVKTHHPGQVFGNPGTTTEEAYASRRTADVLVTFENETGYAEYVPDPWTVAYGPKRFAHLLHSIAAADSMRLDVARAATRNAGYVFVTDDLLPNPWDALPSYWMTELAVVETTNVPVEVGVDGDTPVAFAAWPTPQRAGAAITFTIPAGPETMLQILDLAGRAIRSLAVSAGTGFRSVRWDGLTRSGRRSPPGVYHACVPFHGGALVRRVVIIP